MELRCKIIRAEPDDIGHIRKLLEDCSLPEEGVDKLLDSLLVAVRQSEVIGCAALEFYGKFALLRSVAVHPRFQGKGVGKKLTEAALNHAKNRNIAEVFLLTENADKFFAKYNFNIIERENVPAPVLQSGEFIELCPRSAVAMHLKLQIPDD